MATRVFQLPCALPRLLRRACFAGALAACLSAAAGETPLPLTSPSKAGFAADRLERLNVYCDGLVSSGKYSGLTVLIAREGHILHWKSHGYRDRAAGVALGRNDVFAIYSLTKMMTTVGALMLVEQGRLTLREPVATHLPELGSLKVFVVGSVEAPVLADLARPITLHHLLTHTAGFSNFEPATAPVLAALRSRSTASPQTLPEMVRSLASLPLQQQPGDQWIYGPSTDVVGALIEKVSGQPFDAFLEEKLFRLLGLHDTFFEVPPEKRSRQVAFDVRQPDGSLKPVAPRPRGGAWPSGGGGLYSTPGDYVRFAQMLLNGGVLDGVRILSPKTVALMTRDHLHGLSKPTKIYPASDGFGYGVEVRTDLARSQWLGTEGTYGWNGASTAYCAMDPRENLIAMIWAQHIPNAEFELYERFNNLVYQALEKPAVK